jgi:hypothetical protein
MRVQPSLRMSAFTVLEESRSPRRGGSKILVYIYIYLFLYIYHIMYTLLSPTSVGHAWVFSLQFPFVSRHFPNRVGLDVELEFPYEITDTRLAMLRSFLSSIHLFRGICQTGLALMFSWSSSFVITEAIHCVMTGNRWPSVGRIACAWFYLTPACTFSSDVYLAAKTICI